MPLFEIDNSEQITAIPSLNPKQNLKESDLEELIWQYTDDLVGEGLLTIKRQAQVAKGLIPDIICIDQDSNVIVFELKKTIDRKQLSQALEYAGWAREASLDDLAKLYHTGEDSFWGDLSNFLDSESPKPLSRNPRIVLVSPQYSPNTKSAIRFLTDNGVPITMITVSIYQKDAGSKLVDVEIEGVPRGSSPSKQSSSGTASPASTTYGPELNVKIADLLSAGLLEAGDELTWKRPKVGETYQATVLEDGEIELPDGFRASSPSGAAVKAAGVKAYDGWHAWTRSVTGETLSKLRQRYAAGDFDQADPFEDPDGAGG